MVGKSLGGATKSETFPEILRPPEADSG